MHRLVYRSVALIPATDRENLEILRTAMARNSSMDITGFLLRNPAYFYQCLEGPEANVKTIMDSILSDTRHFGVEILMFDPCTDRMFPEWSMGLEIHSTALLADPMAINTDGPAVPILTTLQWIADQKREVIAYRDREFAEDATRFYYEE